MELLARTCNTERMNIQRILARTFVLIGGLIWLAMVIGAQYAYVGAPLTAVMGYALIVAVAIAAVFVVGLFYENIAAILLVLASVALIVVGIVNGWEAGLWSTVFIFLILPSLVAAALYALAARMQRVCELEV